MKTTTPQSTSGRTGTTTFSMTCYFKEIANYPLLSREEEKDLAEKIRNGDRGALEEMINSNLRLVVKIANDYSRYGLPVEDLVAEGNIGLMKAAERYDPSYGVKFSTYAVWWIKQKIMRALGNQARTIRLPLHLLQQIRDLEKVERDLGYELGRDPSDEELATCEGLTQKKVEELRRVAQPIVSLDEQESEDGVDVTELGAVTSDDAAATPYDEAATNDDSENLRRVLSILNPREQEVIASRFGLVDGESHTLEEIGNSFGVSRERIRQIQRAAIEKLQFALRRLDQPMPMPVRLSAVARCEASPTHIDHSPMPEAIPA